MLLAFLVSLQENMLREELSRVCSLAWHTWTRTWHLSGHLSPLGVYSMNQGCAKPQNEHGISSGAFVSLAVSRAAN